jgi:transketolase
MDSQEKSTLERKARQLRMLILEMIGKLGVGHIGGALSIVEALTVLYYKHMNIDPSNPAWEKRDRFVLSKGHGGPGLYAVLADKGYFPVAWLDTLNRPNTNLPSHCDRLKTPGIDMTAGSLGQGFSAAIGMAVGAKIDKTDIRVYAIIGDGESQEGQIWEAAMFAGHHRLDNVIALQDFNDMQIDGMTADINNLEPIEDKWRSFGWNVYSVDGHDVESIDNAISLGKHTKGKPTMIVLRTTKGKGASFSEGKVSSHNMTITEEQWKAAVEQLKKEPGC